MQASRPRCRRRLRRRRARALGGRRRHRLCRGALCGALCCPDSDMVIALVVGIALNPLAARPVSASGMHFCVKTLLRWAVALLGLRVGLGDIVHLAPQTASADCDRNGGDGVRVCFRAMERSGARLWCTCQVYAAVCGASATLATSTVVPEYEGKKADIAFVVVAVNALATLAMLIYPPLCILLGFDRRPPALCWVGRSTMSHRLLAPAMRFGCRWQYRSDRQAFSGVLALAHGAWRWLVLHAARSRHGEAHVLCRFSRSCFWCCVVVNSAVPLMPSLAAGLCPGEKRAGGSFHRGSAARHRGARSWHVGKDHYRPGLAAHHDSARRERGHLCGGDGWPAVDEVHIGVNASSSMRGSSPRMTTE